MENNTFDRYWQGLPDREQKVYALLSIPAWFSLELAAQLAGNFLPGSQVAADLDLSMTGFISRYERDAWRFERSFREFLLSKAAVFFKEELPEIHTFLAIYYKECSKEGTTAKKREYEYLHLYHRLLLEPAEAGREMLALIARAADQYLEPVVRSLSYMLRLPPPKEGVDMLQEFIELFAACLENLADKNKLKDIRGRIEKLEEEAEGKGDEDALLKQVYRLLILVNSNIPQKHPGKTIEKYQKKLLHLSGAGADSDEQEFSPEERAPSRKESHVKFGQIRSQIDKIVDLHSQGLHDQAASALQYLESLHEGQKDMMCKSYCHIAGRVSRAPGDALALQEMYIDRAIRCNRFDPVAFTSKAELLRKKGRIAEALTYYDMAYRLDPHNEVAITAKAELLGKTGRVQEALELFDRAQQINPHNEVALNAKAELLGSVGRVQEALELFDRAQQINPHNAVPLCARANLLAKSGDFDAAIEAYRAALADAGKNDPYTFCGLGFVLLKRNRDQADIAEARRLFLKAAGIPGSQEIANLGLWTAAARLGDEEQTAYYKKQYEEIENRFPAPGTQFPLVKVEKKFIEIKDQVTVPNMTDIAAYERLMEIIFSYVSTVLLVRW